MYAWTNTSTNQIGIILLFLDQIKFTNVFLFTPHSDWIGLHKDLQRESLSFQKQIIFLLRSYSQKLFAK
ncbi:MAG: hypothetical protein C6Y22_22670 [Hapalosiphonaceae cyanobacterium JJU2]|nr:MAG: hypothetical protein C6Y22_22670 [Hapalosiphonaceae cyanobacterium JJU2]